MTNSSLNNSDDYDPKQLIQELSANINQPNKFAEIFCTAARSQKKIDEVLKENIKGLLKHDSEVRDSIKAIVAFLNKEDWKSYIKKIFFAVWSLVMLFIGAYFNGIFK